MKIVAYYLPQFHAIPENDLQWGRGFTEWDNVKNGKPLFKGHVQPRVPLNRNYYNLLNEDVIIRQCKLAKQNGIYGFCFYHYWFGDKLLLEKPMEIFLKSKECNLKFCISWANESWTNIWKGNTTPSVFIDQKYYDEDEWKKHFEYLLQFFLDNRYIKVNNKPIVVIYRPYLCDVMDKIMQLWNELAKANGFKGIYFVAQRFEEEYRVHGSYNLFDGYIQYYPDRYFHTCKSRSILKNIFFNPYVFFLRWFNKLNIVSYDEVWRFILKDKISKKTIPGAFVDWDNTPRAGERGVVVYGASPSKFKKYLMKQIKRNKNKEFLFLFAWNEWGEGGYLEPDEENGDSYLKAIKEALE